MIKLPLQRMPHALAPRQPCEPAQAKLKAVAPQAAINCTTNGFGLPGQQLALTAFVAMHAGMDMQLWLEEHLGHPPNHPI